MGESLVNEAVLRRRPFHLCQDRLAEGVYYTRTFKFPKYRFVIDDFERNASDGN